MSGDDVFTQMDRDDRRYLILAEVATVLGLSQKEVLAIPNHELPRHGIGRYVIFYKKDLLEYAKRKAREADADAMGDVDLGW